MKRFHSSVLDEDTEAVKLLNHKIDRLNDEILEYGKYIETQKKEFIEKQLYSCTLCNNDQKYKLE